MNELSDLILIIDSREREQKRINSMRSFFEERGAVVDTGAITIKDGNQITSMDYSIEGSYKGKSVNLGISAKSLVDFSGTIGNLSNELARGYLRFDEVGFIFITGCYQTTLSSDGLHAVIRNPAVQDGTADILNTTSMFNALSSWERSGIHCRQILYEEQFPQAVISILNFITKESHEGVSFNTKGVADPITKNKMMFINSHVHMNVPGVGIKTAMKLWDYLVDSGYPPSLHWVTSLAEDELIEAVGTKTGKALFQAYVCRDGWTDIKKSSEEANISPPERKLSDPKGNIPTEFKNASNKKITELNNNEDDKLQLSQVSKGKADELSTLVPLKSDKNKRCVLDSVDGEGTESAREPIDKPHCSRSADLDNKLQAEVLNLIESHQKGIPYTHVVESFKQDESEIYDIVALLMQEGKCYEPRLGLLVPTNPSLQSSPYRNLDGKAGTLIQTKDEHKTEGIERTLGVQSPMNSGNTPQGDDKLQSLSAEHLELAKNRTCAQPSSEPNGIIGTPDISQSSEVPHTPKPSVDTAGGTVLPPLDLSPPVVASSNREEPPKRYANDGGHVYEIKPMIKSLEDAIVDRVYAKPEIDTVVMREFMSRGFQMPEIHKVIKESSKLHKYKQGGDMMIAYKGVKADKEMDVGV